MNLIFQLILGAAWAPVHQITVTNIAFIEEKSFAVSCNALLVIHSLAGKKPASMSLVSISIFLLLFQLTTNIVFLAIEYFPLLMSTIVAVFPGYPPSDINATELSKNDRALQPQSAIAEVAKIIIQEEKGTLPFPKVLPIDTHK